MNKIHDSVVSWAGRYYARGYALVRVSGVPGEEKVAVDTGWQHLRLRPEQLAGYNVGLVGGTMSGGLVCVDVDYPDPDLRSVDILPKTGMIEGRPGAPACHFWYKCGDIGSFTNKKYAKTSRGHIELRASGSHTVVPPSAWRPKPGKEGRPGLRTWFGEFGEPGQYNFDTLLAAIEELGRHFGWDGEPSSPPPPEGPGGHDTKKKGQRREHHLLPVKPSDEKVVDWVAHWLRRAPRSVGGGGGDSVCFRVISVLMNVFCLPQEEVLWLVENIYNHKTRVSKDDEAKWHWSRREICRKMEGVETRPDRASVDSPPHSRSIVKEGPIWVGQGFSNVPDPPQNWVDIKPDVACRRVKIGNKIPFVIHKFIHGLNWTGREAVLATPSNVDTCKDVRYLEDNLAFWLRKWGAKVFFASVPSPTGAIVSVDALPGGWQSCRLLTERPPVRPNPRQYYKTPPVARDRAKQWLLTHSVGSCTKEVVEAAKKEGITEPTLRRAFAFIKKHSLDR